MGLEGKTRLFSKNGRKKRLRKRKTETIEKTIA
jgi:hypothetical protein